MNGVSAHASDDKEPVRPSTKKTNVNGQVAGEDTIMIVDSGNRRGEANQEDGEGSDDDDDAAAAAQLNTTVVSEAHNIGFFNTADSGSQKRQSIDRSASNGHDHKSKRILELLFYFIASINRAYHNAVLESQSAGAQLNMHGVFLHILGDAFGSVIVIINAIICWQVDNDDVKRYLDPALSLVMALIIFSTTIPLFKESALILLQTVPTHINVEEIKKKLLKSVSECLL